MSQYPPALNWKPVATSGLLEADTPLGAYRIRVLPLGCAISFHAAGVGYQHIAGRAGITVEQGMEIARDDFLRRIEELSSRHWRRAASVA